MFVSAGRGLKGWDGFCFLWPVWGTGFYGLSSGVCSFWSRSFGCGLVFNFGAPIGLALEVREGSFSYLGVDMGSPYLGFSVLIIQSTTLNKRNVLATDDRRLFWRFAVSFEQGFLLPLSGLGLETEWNHGELFLAETRLASRRGYSPFPAAAMGRCGLYLISILASLGYLMRNSWWDRGLVNMTAVDIFSSFRYKCSDGLFGTPSSSPLQFSWAVSRKF
ncbi:hypothetical protein U1Q18_021789 [Sarracenia purpurea var. burkii]